MKLYTSLLLVACLAASATAVNKIRCYTCTSLTDQGCDDPINKEKQKPRECTNDITNSVLNTINQASKGISNFFNLEAPQIDANFACLKASYTRTQDGKDTNLVIRSCVPESKNNNCDELKKSAGDKNFFCEECNTDECNAGSSLSFAAALLIPSIALVLARQ